MRKASFILILLCFLTVCSCHKEVVPGSEDIGSGTGSIELRLDSDKAINLQTKATNLEEGLEFNNVLVILVNNSGTVVGNQYVTESSPVSEKTVSFDGLLPGNYHVYAYANIDATAWQQSETITTQEKGVAIGSSFSSFLDRELVELTGTSVPSDPSASMLLSGHKEIHVGLARVTETLDLIRPVVRFKVTVRNHTKFPVTVDELRFSSFNPDKAYLLDHRDASGVPSVPAAVTYREMPAFDTSAGDDNSVAMEAEEVIYQRLMYENAYPGTYKIYATLSLDRSTASMSTIQLSLGDNPFGIIDYATLNAMEKGDRAKVFLINPRTTTRSGRLYYGIGNTGIAWESCGYNSYNSFLLRALAIYNEEAAHIYDGFNYNGFGNGNGISGLAGWTGNSGDPAYKGNTFDYTGARSRYFLSLTRHDSYFSIDGLSTNAPSQTSLPKVRIATGIKPNNRFPNDLPVSYLVQFVNDNSSDSDYGKYLKSDCMYNANSEAAATLCKVSWEDGGSAQQDHQFILFGKCLTGGPLKRILKENNKEVPLTYMARNEEINVIINVYYSDKSGELDFVVDNTTWKTATTSQHTFN